MYKIKLSRPFLLLSLYKQSQSIFTVHRFTQQCWLYLYNPLQLPSSYTCQSFALCGLHLHDSLPCSLRPE